MATPLPDPADLPSPRDVVQARWHPRRGLRLRTDDRTVRLPRAMFGGEWGARLAWAVRGAVPPDRHVGWPRFCRLVVLPALRSPCPTRPLRWFEVRGDDPRHLSAMEGCFLAVQVLIVGGVAIGAPVLPGWLGFVCCGAMGGLIWLARRNRKLVPPTIGERVLRVRWRAFAGLYVAFVAGAVGGTAAAARLDARGVPFWLCFPLLPGGAVFAGAAFIKLARPYDGPFDRMRDAEAVDEWDALHAVPQRDPAWQAALWEEAETRSDPGAPKRPGR